MTTPDAPPPAERGVYCNRTLNLRGVRAVGYDMDYTLIHYHIHEWERRAYDHVKRKLKALGWPVERLTFDPDLIIRGLILDLERGNVLKANRFGYVKRAFHGTTPLPFDEQRTLYGRTLVDLEEPRWQFLNTLFSLSEACLYAQLVDLLDRREIEGVLGYADLYRIVRMSIDEAHLEGELKAEILTNPDRFVDLDPEVALTLQDQRVAGTRLMLITNSEWAYARDLMHYAFDRFLPSGTTWRDLFDLVIVAARKPTFFLQRGPIFRVVDDAGLLAPAPMGIEGNGIYFGGNARMVEEYLGVSGDEILYVGDHIYTDVHVSKDVLRWRTALVLRELETEIATLRQVHADQDTLRSLMEEKERLEFESCQLRLAIQRKRQKVAPIPEQSGRSLERDLAAVRTKVQRLDERIGPLASASARLNNDRWGLLMRAGNDKSHLARQVERYADIYMSRVSNLLYQTPFVYLRAPRGTLPHDMTLGSVEAEEV